MATARLLGASIKRREDPRFITGKGNYTDDLKLPGMTYAVFVRSPHGNAKIRGIDVTKAKAHPGVVAVFTGKDMTGVNSLPCGWLLPELKVPAHPPLASEAARYVGDPVAVVIAESQDAANDAADLVSVDWQALPSVTSTERAAQKGTAQIHEVAPDNVAFRWQIGDAAETEAAFKKADVVVKKRIVNQRLVANAMEPRACVARYEDATGDLTLWVTSQNPHVHRLLMTAFVLGIPEHKVRVIAPDVGGGFGSKIFLYNEETVCSWATRQIKRPIRWTSSRREAFQTDAHGRDHITDAEVALSRDGKFLGLRVKTTANLGAYLSTFAPAVPTYLYGTLLNGVYTFGAIHCEVTGVFTNTTPVDAYRGAGRPEACYLLERMADAAAAALKMDPARDPEEELHPQVRQRVPDQGGAHVRQRQLRGGLRPRPPDARLQEVPGRAGRRPRQRPVDRRGLLHLHRGVQYRAVEGGGLARRAGRALGVRQGPRAPDGHGDRVHRLSLARAGARDDVRPARGPPPRHPDGARGHRPRRHRPVPFGMGTYGSRSASVGGTAILMSLNKIKEKGKKIAAHLLEAAPQDIEYADGQFQVKGSPQKAVPFGQVALTAYVPHNYPEGVEPGLEETTSTTPSNFCFPFGAHACVVEVDPDTGHVKILRYLAVDDVGNVINPMIVDGMVHGGIAQGVAQALWEEAVYDDASGQLVSGSMMDYTLPKADMLPFYETDRTETPTPVNPLGVKGAGETGTIASTPAVVNAVVDALSGLGVDHIEAMPLTPERVWKTAQAAKSKK